MGGKEFWEEEEVDLCQQTRSTRRACLVLCGSSPWVCDVNARVYIKSVEKHLGRIPPS
jgi:hypothetical protein